MATKEERAAKRAQEFTEDRAKLEAQLQQTIDLVTAMFWEMECGENLSNEQVAAAWDDRVLGVLWWRIWDYAEFRSRSGHIRRIAYDDETSLFLEYARKRSSADVEAWKCDHTKPIDTFSSEVRRKAVKGHPKARAMRRRYTRN